VAPPRKNLLLVSNGLLAKFGIWRAQRRGTAERLEQLVAEKARSAPGPQPAGQVLTATVGVQPPGGAVSAVQR